MLASKIREEYLAPKEINTIISSSGLLSLKLFLTDVLKRSRNKDLSAVELFDLQSQIAEKIIKCEKQIAIFKKTANRETQNDEWRSREIYKAHRRMLKAVMDGVAFRFLNFERPTIRQLAEHNQTGFLTNGFISEMKKGASIVNESGFFVILNDLTNFLRYGDLTIISPEGNIIDEVKTTGKPKGDQKRDLHNLIEMLNKHELKSGNQKADYIKIPGRPTTFLNQIEQLINKSKESVNGAFASKVSPYLWVSSVYTPKMIQYFKTNGKIPQLPTNPFPQTDISAPTNSLMFFDQFSPNIMPFTAFPFDEDVICEILMGQVQLKMIINEKELIKSFKGKGWDLVLPSRAEILKIYDSDNINKIKEAILNPKYFPTLTKGHFSFKIPREEILRIETEFYSVKTFVDISEYLFSSRFIQSPRKMLATGFVDEASIWR